MASIIIYGIANCDTVLKTMQWFRKEQVPFLFHDFRKDGIGETLLKEWVSKAGWQQVLNLRSRNLKEMTKGQLPANEKEAIKCMLIDPSVIKRPVLVTDSVLHFGYNEKIFQTIKK